METLRVYLEGRAHFVELLKGRLLENKALFVAECEGDKAKLAEAK